MTYDAMKMLNLNTFSKRLVFETVLCVNCPISIDYIMKKLFLPAILIFSFGLTSCHKAGIDSAVSEEQQGSSSSSGEAGVITAAEWNDLENWPFWSSLVSSNADLQNVISEWGYYTNNRVEVKVKDQAGNMVVNAKVELKKDDEVLFTAKTDNRGRAELWLGLNDEVFVDDTRDYKLFVNGVHSRTGFSPGINPITIESANDHENVAQVAFVVDVTGSMGDELNFLKLDMQNVIERVGAKNPTTTLQTGAVFYRDNGDDFVTKLSSFTNDVSSTLDFINQMNAQGGGDTPEAVHSALEETLGNLEWNENARTRIVFLILDASPHLKTNVIASLQSSINQAASMGVKIVPITASGISKETEFIMRSFSVATNGTYVFITDDSGVGESHIQATVGDYQVEYLNDLLVRLIHENVE